MQQKNKKLLSLAEYQAEIMERFIEFNTVDGYFKSPYFTYAWEYSKWALADDINNYVQLRHSLSKYSKETKRLPLAKEDGCKEDIINGVYEIIDGVADHGLWNSKIPEEVKIRQEEEKRYEKEEKKRLKFDILSLEERMNLAQPTSGEDIHQIFKDKSLEETSAWFQEFEHIEWFDAFWEIPIYGSSSDLIDLTSYGFMGYLNCGVNSFHPWTLRKICGVSEFKLKESVDPIDYIRELIKNCKEFVQRHPGERSALGDGNILFNKAIRHAETRLQLDTKKYVNTDDFAYITGLNIRTFANIGLIQPKKIGENSKILCKDALNFLTNSRKRNRENVDRELSRDFYPSIWQEQAYYGETPTNEGDEEFYFISVNCFKSKLLDKVFQSDTTFKRTLKDFDLRMAPHNKERIEWIGEGKTFSEINRASSKYRKNVKRKSYSGNESSIIQDLEYDLKKGLIKRLK